MDFKNENEFERNHDHSSEMDPNIQEENARELYREQQDDAHAVDVTFTTDAETTKESEAFENAQESEPFVSPSKMSEQTRSSQQPEKKKRKVGPLVSTIAAGVIGSVLTLTVLPHTDYLKNYYSSGAEQVKTSTGAEVKPVTAQPSQVSSSSIADTVEKLSKTIVGIVNYQQQQTNSFWGNSGDSGYSDNSGNSGSSESVEAGSGSGVIFQKTNGIAYIVTNNHVVEGATKLEISLYDGQKTTAEVVGTDALTDLAVLKIDAKYVTATAEFGDSSTLRPGDQVYAIGNPLGLDLSRTVTQGIVSAIDRSISVSTSAGNWETNVIQTDAAINPGNSGGALINPQGQVVGINSLKIAEDGVEGLGFAIPSNDLIPIVNELIKSGKITRPYLGVGLADLTEAPEIYWRNLPNDVKSGVLIMSVEPDSVAAKAGFQQYDVVVSMNDTTITNSTDLRKYLYTKVKKGDTVKFKVYRNGKLTTLEAKITE